MFRALGLVGLLFAFWLLLSGFFVPFLIAAGLGCAIAVALLARRKDVLDREGRPLHLGPRALWYSPWLIKEIVKLGWDVARLRAATLSEPHTGAAGPRQLTLRALHESPL